MELNVKMNKTKITIIKVTKEDEIIKEYGNPELDVCPIHKMGQVFYADHRKPEGFCDEAWRAIQPFVFACSHGAKYFYFGKGWNSKPGIAIGACPDGFRPVIFKIEATDIESTRNN